VTDSLGIIYLFLPSCPVGLVLCFFCVVYFPLPVCVRRRSAPVFRLLCLLVSRFALWTAVWGEGVSVFTSVDFALGDARPGDVTCASTVRNMCRRISASLQAREGCESTASVRGDPRARGPIPVQLQHVQ